MKTRKSFPLKLASIGWFLFALSSPSLFGQTVEMQSPVTRSLVLDNGMGIIVREDHSSPVVALQLWVRAGSIYEEENLGGGLSHYVEHLVFKGTKDIPRQIQRLGGEVNAYTSLDHTVFYIEIPAEHWRRALVLLRELVLEVDFEPEGMAREKEVILKEINMGLDDPDRRLSRLLWSTAFQVHPYRHPVIGYREVFQRLTREDVLSYYQELYVPNNMFITAVGDFREEEVVSAASEIFSPDGRKAYPLVSIPTEPPQLAGRTAEEEMDVALARLALGFHIPSLHHPDLYPLDVLAILIGQGKSSHLYRKVREELGLVYSINAYSYTPAYPGLLVITATTDEDKLEASRGAILDVLERCQQEPVGDDELEKARRQVISDYLNSLTTVEGQARDIGSNQLLAGSWEFSRDYVAGISGVSAEDIVRVARTYLTGENMTLAVIRPLGTSPPSAPASQVPKSDIKKYTLENALRLLVREDPTLPLVSLRMVFLGGVLAENEDDNGVCNLLARMLLKGTESRTASEIVQEIEDKGGAISSYSGRNSFGCSLDILADQLESGLEVLGDLLQSSTFPPEEIEKEKSVILAQIQAEEDQPQGLAARIFREALFGNHPYRFLPLGSQSSVANLSKEDLSRFYRQYCCAANGVLAIFGDVKTDVLLPLVEARLGGWEKGEEAQLAGRHELPPSSPREKVARKRGIEQTVLLLGFPGTDLASPDRYSLELLSSISSGLGAPLFGKVRGDLGLVYYIGAYQLLGLDPGAFVFYAGTVPGKSDEVISEIWKEIDRIKREGVTGEELERNQNRLLGQYEFKFQTNSELAFQAALDELYGLGYGAFREYSARIQAVTADELRRTASAYFRKDAGTQAIVEPETNEDDSPASDSSQLPPDR